MAYDGETKIFTRILTSDEEAAMLSFVENGDGVDRELTQAVDGVINHCVDTFSRKAVADAQQATWDALSDEDKAAAVTSAKDTKIGPLGPPIKPPILEG